MLNLCYIRPTYLNQNALFTSLKVVIHNSLKVISQKRIKACGKNCCKRMCFNRNAYCCNWTYHKHNKASYLTVNTLNKNIKRIILLSDRILNSLRTYLSCCLKVIFSFAITSHNCIDLRIGYCHITININKL